MIEVILLNHTFLDHFYRKVFPDFLENKIHNEIIGCANILEIGCGPCSRVVTYIQNVYSVGVDGFSPVLKLNKSCGYFQDYVKADINYLPFSSGSFDCVIALDVIEHLTKKQGLQLITNMETMAKKNIVIYTPNGYVHKDDLEDDNPLQEHKSGWVAADFSFLGYTIFGIHGLIKLRGEHSFPVLKPRILGEYLSRLTDKYVFSRPSLAFQLLCIKRKTSSE